MAISRLESLAKTLAADGDFSRTDAREVAKTALADRKVSDTERKSLNKIATTYQDKYDVGGSRALREFMANPAPSLPAPIEVHGKDPFHPDNLAERFTELVSKADTSIDAAFFQVLDPKIVDSLADAAGRGVKVRLVTDDNYFDAQDTSEKLQQRVDVKGEANAIHIELKRLVPGAPDTAEKVAALEARMDALDAQISKVEWPSSQSPEMNQARAYAAALKSGAPADKAALSKEQFEISHELSGDKVLLKYRPAYQKLLDAGVQIVDDDSSKLSHNKYMVMDDSVVWGGSYNMQGLLSDRDPTKGLPMTADNAVIMQSSKLADAFQADFNQMIAGNHHSEKTRSELDGVPVDIGGVTVTPYFSPDDSIPGHLADGLESYLADYEARKAAGAVKEPPTVRVAAFTFSYKGMERVVDALIKLKAAGADVQVIISGATARAGYSAYHQLEAGGITPMVAHSSIMMHNKYLSVEDGPNGFVWTGSANFTGPAFHDNDEHVLKIDSADVAREYEKMFDSLRDNLEPELESVAWK